MQIAIEPEVATAQYFGHLLLAIILAIIGNIMNIPISLGICCHPQNGSLLI
jgi:hypothetical protein